MSRAHSYLYRSRRPHIFLFGSVLKIASWIASSPKRESFILKPLLEILIYRWWISCVLNTAYGCAIKFPEIKNMMENINCTLAWISCPMVPMLTAAPQACSQCTTWWLQLLSPWNETRIFQWWEVCQRSFNGLKRGGRGWGPIKWNKNGL